MLSRWGGSMPIFLLKTKPFIFANWNAFCWGLAIFSVNKNVFCPWLNGAGRIAKPQQCTWKFKFKVLDCLKFDLNSSVKRQMNWHLHYIREANLLTSVRVFVALSLLFPFVFSCPCQQIIFSEITFLCFKISVLLPLMENKTLMIPGREDSIDISPGFQFFATRRYGRHKINLNVLTLITFLSLLCNFPSL